MLVEQRAVVQENRMGLNTDKRHVTFVGQLSKLIEIMIPVEFTQSLLFSSLILSLCEK